MTFEEFMMFVVAVYLVLSLVVMVVMTIFMLSVYYKVWKFKKKYKTPLSVLNKFEQCQAARIIKTFLPVAMMMASWWLKMHPDEKKKRKN